MTDSDSVNLGSNPSSPATKRARKQRSLPSSNVLPTPEHRANAATTAKHATHESRHSPDVPSVVYFASCEGFVKIGVTMNLKERIGVLATSSPFPIECLGTLPGGRELEAWLHSRFASHKQTREWFYNRGSVASFIKQVVLSRGRRQQSALERWRLTAPCTRCGGRLREMAMPVQPGVPVAYPLIVCRSCDATWAKDENICSESPQ